MAAEPAVEASGLEKSFGNVKVLAGVDLTVARASRYALLGPNGAGKTTTVRILSALTRPDAGRARVAGCDVVGDRHRLRHRISLTGQYAALDGLQTGEENLRLVGRLSGLSPRQARRRAAELLERFGLVDAARRRVAAYSGGMMRRLDLAGRLVLWQVITELSRSGVTVFLTTQYLEEADQLADRIAVIDAGRVVAEGTPADLKAQVAAQRLELRLTGAGAFDEVARAAGDRVVHADRSDLIIGVATDGSAAQVRALLDELDPGRSAVQAFSVRSASLDDVFLALTGHANQEVRTGHPSGRAAHEADHEKETIGV